MPITQAANILNMLQAAVAAAERVFELLDEVEEPEDGKNAKALTQPKGRVEFSDVTFGYDPGKPILRGVDIKAKPGQTIAIVGPTGAGKTTLVNLLMRFYDVDAGEITVDGENITKITRGSLRRAFGMVLQDTWLFHGTIRDNIAYGRAGASEAEVVAAAKAAHAHHFIRTLPEGYDTILSEDGTNISQGQRQLLTIARAVLADPAILILDEATSSVDTRTELLIQRAMAELMKGRTSFVIAHRLSTIQGADTILVVNDGQIVEQGTHSQLLAKQGFYAELYYSQFSGETHSQAR
jgi:ATP-binding cassette subfamily B protein